MSKTYSAGIVTAYGAAKRAGYHGTYEDFCRQQAGYAESAATVEQAKNTAVSAANTATTKAGEAATAATAAQTAKTQTEQAASQALTDIGTAGVAAVNAVHTEGATQTANARSQAQAAAQSATTASTKASEASASATSAGQSATNAAASATSAAQSASNAQDVLDSIPADYSDLSEDVVQLKADLSESVGDLKSTIGEFQELSDSIMYRIDGTVNKYGNPYTNTRINSDGVYVTDTEYQVLRYTLSGLTYLKIKSDDRFVFQNSTLRPTTAPNNGLVGFVYGAGESIIKVPDGATNLYISTPIDGSTALVERVTPIIPMLSDSVGVIGNYDITWEVGGINNQGGDSTNTNTAYSRTNYIPIGNVQDAFYYKVKTVTQLAICAVYDEGKNIISVIKTDSGSVVEVNGTYTPNVPNAYYIRFCSQASNGYIPTLHRVNGFSELTDKAVNLSKLNEDIVTRADGTNYIDYDALTERRYINASGVMVETSNMWVTDYIPIEAEKTYYQTNVHSTYYAFYDETKTFISGYDTLGNLGDSFTTPSGAKYARFTLALSAFNYKNAWINDKSEMPAVYQLALNKDIKVYAGSGTDVSNPCDYGGEEITTFVKGICIGDSLTAGAFNITSPTSGNQVYDKNSYPRSLERITGVAITNAGHSGYSSAEWYQAYQNEDFSGHDFAILQLGVNDQIRYDEFGDTSKTAFENIFAMLKTQNPKIKIFVANIIPALSYQAQGYLDFSDDLLTWVEAKHLTDPDIIPLDIHQYGHTADSEAFNCGHLSAFGYNQLARDYKAYISWYMAQNRMEFRQVQFIGAEYSYSD